MVKLPPDVRVRGMGLKVNFATLEEDEKLNDGRVNINVMSRTEIANFLLII
jgi:hypothetical protein